MRRRSASFLLSFVLAATMAGWKWDIKKARGDDAATATVIADSGSAVTLQSDAGSTLTLAAPAEASTVVGTDVTVAGDGQGMTVLLWPSENGTVAQPLGWSWND